jgi:hypothetical protein
MPYLSVDDAGTVVSVLETRLAINKSAQVALVNQRVIHDFEINSVRFPWAMEQFASDGEQNTTSRMLGAVVGTSVFVLSCTSLGEGFDWAEVTDIAFRQESKIRAKLDISKLP